MKNVTISLEDSFLASVKEHASKRGVSLNSLVKSVLERELGRNDPNWAESAIELSKHLNVRSSDGRPMSREESHDRQALR